jgi:hypoxanthine phosphoribosyltransferase
MLETIKKSEIKVLFSAAEIQSRIENLAKTINQDYQNLDNIVVVGVLKGSFMFTADLVRYLKPELQLEFIKLSSYDDGTESSGKVKAIDLSLPDMSGKNVLLVEDIVDSGRTAKFLLDFFKTQEEVASVKLVSLFNKECRRSPEFKDLKPDYCCFDIDDHFIVGYGLDYAQKYRELPYVGFIEA